MQTIVINKCYGGFSISDFAKKLLGVESAYINNAVFGYDDDENEFRHRTDPRLILLIRAMGVEKISGNLASLKLVDIPDDVEWEIDEYDGTEWVSEKHRMWS